MSQRRGAYPPEFRQQMVELVKAGRKPSELAREFGCHDTSIGAWVRQANADELGGGRPDAPLTTAERQELAQLRKQLRQVTMERDILAKATAWFANKDSGIDKTFTRWSRQIRPTYLYEPCANALACHPAAFTTGARVRRANVASMTR